MPQADISEALVRRTDEAVTTYLKSQNLDAKSRWYGGIPDGTELYGAGPAAGFCGLATAAFCYRKSKHYRDRQVFDRIQLASKFMQRCQSPDGNIDLLITNFNSPPDTGFVVHTVAEAASVARKHGAPEIEKAMEPFLRKAGEGLVHGGVHTPNHRWVVSAALAQLHDLWPNPAYLRRIDQWLAEGIDIDSEGQWSERSTTIYNTVCDRAYTTLALKLKRPQLLDPVRKNLEAMLYFLHGDGEVVTEISRRQDLNERGTMDRYWYPLRALAVLDKDGRFAALARRTEERGAALGTLLDHPEIALPMVPDAPLPDNFQRVFPGEGIARYRRGPTSASILLNGTSRFFTIRRGDAVIEAVRFASAFFGKGQFVPTESEALDGGFLLRQRLESGYYQPLGRPIKQGTAEWGAVRRERQVSELCKLEQTARVTEIPGGFRLRLQSTGTTNVPLTVEIGLREGSVIEAGAETTLVRRGANSIRIVHGPNEHKYFQVRGAETPLPGPKVYVTGYAPFDRTIEITAA